MAAVQMYLKNNTSGFGLALRIPQAGWRKQVASADSICSVRLLAEGGVMW